LYTNTQIHKEASLSNIKAVIFDCDGVLFDSQEANIRFYNSILTHFGHSALREDQVAYVHMHSLQESLVYLFPEEQREEVFNYCRTLDFREFNKFLKIEKGLLEFLRFLQTRYKTDIATNRTVSMDLVLREFHLEPYFGLVVTAADVEKPKPHPETIEKILTTFSIKPDEALFIGDSEVDQMLAAETGVIFIAYKNPKLPAAYCVENFYQVRELLTKESS